MNGIHETKSEIRARIDELEKLSALVPGMGIIQTRLEALRAQLADADEDLSSSIIRSHKALCKVKNMGEKAAYGNDPAVYYTLGVCGEAGEMANEIVKSLRNGHDRGRILQAVKSELPDVIIYSYVLAYVLDINLSQLVNEKVDIVVQRAYDGYYGGPLQLEQPNV